MLKKTKGACQDVNGVFGVGISGSEIVWSGFLVRVLPRRLTLSLQDLGCYFSWRMARLHRDVHDDQKV